MDPQSSTRLLVSVAGVVTDAESYKAFGESLVSSGSTEHPYRYVGEQGYQWDEDDRTYVRARHLDVAEGRWLSLAVLAALQV